MNGGVERRCNERGLITPWNNWSKIQTILGGILNMSVQIKQKANKGHSYFLTNEDYWIADTVLFWIFENQVWISEEAGNSGSLYRIEGAFLRRYVILYNFWCIIKPRTGFQQILGIVKFGILKLKHTIFISSKNTNMDLIIYHKDGLYFGFISFYSLWLDDGKSLMIIIGNY